MTQKIIDKYNYSHIYWLGGAPRTGKTAVSQLLADQLGLLYVQADSYARELEQRATPDKQPISYMINQLEPRARGLAVVELTALEELLRLEEIFDYLIVELEHLPRRPIIIEGGALLPSLVDNYLSEATQAIWLTPTEEFGSEKFLERIQSTHNQGMALFTNDPEVATERWLARDQAIAKHIINDAKERAFQHHVVDGSLSIACTADLIARRYGLVEDEAEAPKVPGNFLSLPGAYNSVVSA